MAKTPLAHHFYRQLLRLVPRRLRERHGGEMAAMFLAALADARPRGVAATAAVWARAVIDLLGARFERRTPTASHVFARRSSGRQASMLGSDVRSALRSLTAQKGAALLVIGMLALGIAANIAVFSLVNGLFLKPFPYPHAERLVYINETAPTWNLEYVGINYPDFDQWRRSQQAFEAIALVNDASYNFSDGGGTQRVNGAQVTHDFAAVLGVKPLVGRMFTADEDRPNAPRVVVLTEGLWRERFGADPSVVGRTIRLHSEPYTVVGVMPATTAPADDGVGLWVPVRGDPNQTYQSYGGWAMGRLKPGVTIAAAEKDLRRAHEPIWQTREKARVVSPFVRDLRTEMTTNFTTATWVLSIAVALLLVVACANVASLLLARAIARRREMGIRLALGASRLRLVRQLFVENVVLSTLGGAVGVVAGQWALRGLLAAAPNEVPRWAAFNLDLRAVLFAIGASLATAVLFGLAPALHAFQRDLQSTVHATTKGTTSSPNGRRTLRVLVAAECALAALLLVSGGLLLRAYDRVRQVDPGFRTNGVLTFGVLLPTATYPDDAKRLAFWERLNDRMGSLPGVVSASLITCAPLGCHWGNFYDAEGRGPRRPDEADPVVLNRFADASYRRTMGIALVRGRFLEPGDGRPGRTGPVVVNQTFARTFWPGVADPIGRRIKGRGAGAPWLTVVGVVADIKHYGLERPMRPGIYRPLAEQPSDSLTVVVHASVEPGSLVPLAQRVVGGIDPELPLYNVRTMEQALTQSLRVRALYSWMLGVFAALALVLALGGTYGVSSYLVTQRRREMAIRVALGARAADIFRVVLGGSLGVVAAGVAIGAGTSVLAARYLTSLLFGVKPNDALVLGGAVTLLILTALAANFWPARRAAQVDPVSALRAE